MTMEKLSMFNRHKTKRTKLQKMKSKLLSIVRKVLPIPRLGSSTVLERVKGILQKKSEKKEKETCKTDRKPNFLKT